MTSKEALEKLKFIADKELNIGFKSYKDLQEFWNYEEPLKVIEDLVERDTPMKVKSYEGSIFREYKCQCGQRFNGFYQLVEVNFCPKCGQRLDWSQNYKEAVEKQEKVEGGENE